MSFKFDSVFTTASAQVEVYEDVVKPMLNDFLNGINGCMMVYGQTGTSKTYTIGNQMQEINHSAGVLPRFLNDLFSLKKNESIINISFSEVKVHYNRCL
jgi:Cdc6-like AAA superfamily ATPase